MAMANSKVTWSRPVENRYGELVYASKCGRFSITKKSWIAPSVSTSYVLRETMDPRERPADCETLGEAKQLASVLAGEWE